MSVERKFWEGLLQGQREDDWEALQAVEGNENGEYYLMLARTEPIEPNGYIHINWDTIRLEAIAIAWADFIQDNTNRRQHYWIRSWVPELVALLDGGVREVNDEPTCCPTLLKCHTHTDRSPYHATDCCCG